MIEPDNREKFLICVNNIHEVLPEPLTIGNKYEHISDDSEVLDGGVDGLLGARELYYTIIDDEGEKHNYPKCLFKPV